MEEWASPHEVGSSAEAGAARATITPAVSSPPNVAAIIAFLIFSFLIGVRGARAGRGASTFLWWGRGPLLQVRCRGRLGGFSTDSWQIRAALGIARQCT